MPHSFKSGEDRIYSHLQLNFYLFSETVQHCIFMWVSNSAKESTQSKHQHINMWGICTYSVVEENVCWASPYLLQSIVTPITRSMLSTIRSRVVNSSIASPSSRISLRPLNISGSDTINDLFYTLDKKHTKNKGILGNVLLTNRIILPNQL